MQTLTSLTLSLLDKGLCPDYLIRQGIRHLLRKRLREISVGDAATVATRKSEFIQDMARSAIALRPEKANAQHYELPTGFFQHVLGPHLKYSSAFWPPGVDSLEDAERAGLRETCSHAQIQDGQSILELGCGWGSLSLWMAKHYPRSLITTMSNSSSQREYVERQAEKRGLRNLRVLTCDMNEFDYKPDTFDRVISVEMFEHMRNWQLLMGRIYRWLKPQGRFFLHIFVHRHLPYFFEVRDASDWMSQHFFTGGMMPSDDLPLQMQTFTFLQQWQWDGIHYEKTANAWLTRMDAQQEALWPLFEQAYGMAHAGIWWMRWRVSTGQGVVGQSLSL